MLMSKGLLKDRGGEVSTISRAGSVLTRNLTFCLLAGILALGTGCRGTGPRPVTISRTEGANSCVGKRRSPALSVLTFNVHGLPGWFTGRPVDRYERLAEEIRKLDAYFVFLQEVWMKSALNSIPVDGTWWVASDGMPFFFFRRNGLLVLSRYPIVSGQFHPFRSGRLPDSLVRKGVLKVTADLGEGQLLNLWNLHLQAGVEQRVRQDQLAELKGWLAGARDGQVADVVAGDFNFTPDSVEYRVAEGFLGQDLQVAAHEPHWPTYDGGGVGKGQVMTLDYIFLRGGAEVHSSPTMTEVVFAEGGQEGRFSDHLGLHAVMWLDDSLPEELAGVVFGSGGSGMAVASGEMKGSR